jgi:CHAD domain-containing protein
MNTEHRPNARPAPSPTEDAGPLPLPGGIGATTLFLLGRSIERLEDPGLPPAWVVHEVRKDLKRARALLRLGAGVPGARRLEKGCGAAARKLSHLRDTDAISETLARLCQRADARQLAALTVLVEELARGRASGASAPGLRRGTAEEVAQRLRDIRGALDPGAFERLDAVALDRGLARSRAAAAAKFRYLVAHPGMPRFHDFRKAVKRELHQRELGGRPFDRMERATLRKLAEVLGELQDLDVLRHTLRDAGRWEGPVRRLVSEAMRELKARALRLGAGRYPRGESRAVPAAGPGSW